ncbi:MAG: GNAT family N-acetyltransferase, partial [Anaerolineales bacterium]
PILVAEFGYVSFPGVYEGTGGEKAHAEVVAGEYAGMSAPYVCGAAVWCWADHPWPAATFTFANHLGISPYGVVARNRRKKRPYWLIRQLFRERQGIQEPPQISHTYSTPAGFGVTLVRTHMENIPQVPFPEGFGIRPMRLDEGGLWTDIWNDAESENTVDAGLFHREFSHDYLATTWRSYVVTDPRGLAVGIISGWYNQQFQGRLWGVIHWVALRRRVWGKGLGKAMMSHAMNQLAKEHDRVYLGTQTKRFPAIKIYLDFGFVPLLDFPGAEDVWREVAANLYHPTFVDLGWRDPE